MTKEKRRKKRKRSREFYYPLRSNLSIKNYLKRFSTLDVLPYSDNRSVKELLLVEGYLVTFKTKKGNVYRLDFEKIFNRMHGLMRKLFFKPEVF